MVSGKRYSRPPPISKMKVSTPGSYTEGQIQKLGLSVTGSKAKAPNQLSTSDQLTASDQLSPGGQHSTSDQLLTSDQTSTSGQLSTSDQLSSSDQLTTSIQLSTSDQLSTVQSNSDQTSTTNQASISYQPPSSDPQAINDQLASSDTPRNVTKTRAQYMTKSRILMAKQKDKEDKNDKFKIAFKAMKEIKFKSIRKCAQFFDLPKSTLQRLVNSDSSEFKGSGKFSSVLTPEEEKQIIDHVVWRQEVGCGLSFEQLGLLLQEVFLGVKEANPSRLTGFEDSNHLPYLNWVRRFSKRHSISEEM